MLDSNLYVALIHYPVMNKKGLSIGSALTTIDLHDIARASMTFGVKGFYVVTPYEDQATLAQRIIDHWTTGVGSTINPDRKKALELIRIAKTFDQVVKQIKCDRGEPVVSIATSASASSDTPIGTKAVKHKLESSASHVIVFGTAWGLSDEIMKQCDYILAPVRGPGDYNHLSVRSAASIYLDRIMNGR